VLNPQVQRQTGRFIYLLLFFVAAVFNAHGNFSDIQFEHYSVADGLSSNTISDIVEDEQGFIWFATLDGLNRFDGYEFKQYKHEIDDPNSLPDQVIRRIYLDKQNNLWVGTNNGLARYNAEQDNFIRYDNKNSTLTSNIIWAIDEGQQNVLLISDEDSLYQYNKEQDSFIPIEVKGAVLPKDINYIFIEQERTWLGSYGHGIYMLDNTTNILYDLNEENPWSLYIDAKFAFDVKKINDNYWLATEKGAYVFSSSGSLLEHFSTSSRLAIVGDNVRSLTQAEDGNIWLGTTEGISIISPSLTTIHSVDNSNKAQVNLQNRLVFKIFKDSKNTLWLATYTGGVHKLDQHLSNIRHFQNNPNSDMSLSDNLVWGMAESSDGQIWIATQTGGINRFDLKSGRFEHYLQDFAHSIWDIEIDELDQIWLATQGGLFVFKLDVNGNLRKIKELFKGQMVESLAYLNDQMWLWDNGRQLNWVNPVSLETKSITLPNRDIKFLKPVYFDKKGDLWLVSNLGLSIYDIENQQFNQLILNVPGQEITYNTVSESDNAYWVSTLGQGIYKLDKTSYKVIQHINQSNGLSNNVVVSFVHHNNFGWAATLNGIDQVSLENAKVVKSISKELFDFNELNQGSSLLTSNGDILFGGTKGFHMFSPDELITQKAEVLAAPVFTRLSIFNQPVGVNSPYSPLQKAINLSDEITLPNSASPFSLTFAQLSTVRPEAQKYRYQMSNLNDQWLEADKRTRQASFTNLTFGSYDLYVQSQESGGPWSPSAHLRINVSPPIWLNNNALILYGFICLFIIAYWFKQYSIRRAAQRSVEQSEERLKLTLWSSGDELWDWDIYQGQVIRANTWGSLDFPQDDIRVNSAYQANIHPNDIEKVQASLREHLAEKTEYYEMTYRAKTFKGEWIWILDRGKVVGRDNNNQPIRMTGTLKNISHLKQAEEQLKLFKRSIETISDGVFIADTNFRFISVNQSYCRKTGETREQALASYLNFHQYAEAFTEEVKKSLRHKGNWNGEVESRHANGDKYEIELNIDAVHDEDGKVSHYVGVFSDITSRKSTEKELLKLANTDPLTELPNRSFFQASHFNMVRKNISHALFCLDMDNFKKINDSLGHQTGDILIKQIAKRLQKIAGTAATCYRLGGDEFSILFDQSRDMHRITHLAQTILDDMARPFLINKQEFVLGASVGIAFYPEDGNTPQELLKNADTAMYFAKNAGGNKYQFFSGEMNQNAVRQLQIENLIRHGLKEDLFTVFYQPKVDIATGRLVSMEALVRFEHPEKGIVTPNQFIPLAEQTGQIIEIGEVVMRKACEDTKRWVAQGLFTGRVAVNLSAKQFELPDLDDRIERILKEVGLSTLHLECEITEGTLMQDPDQALRMMERLRDRGIHLALDDFGTGYSSLAYLKRFPLNTLKIDKAFIDDIATSSVDKHMTAAIIQIAHNLGLKVVAEGVEHEKQLSILRHYKCEMIQGFLYSKPLSSVRFEQLLKENQELYNLMRQTNK
jgi:diguanylate cyclase (GGDEF)-like protein/PAS domain S-box-containing protein